MELVIVQVTFSTSVVYVGERQQLLVLVIDRVTLLTNVEFVEEAA